jgi:hypothetical protein
MGLLARTPERLQELLEVNNFQTGAIKVLRTQLSPCS